MFFNILYPLSDTHPFLNVFKYISFRAACATLTSLLISFLIGPAIIRWLKKTQGKGQPIRKTGPEHHLITKKGTPTMGGLLILFSLAISTLLWADWKNPYVWIVLLVTLALGFVGAVDDYIKVKKYDAKGMMSKTKFLAQLAIGGAAAYFLTKLLPESLNSHIAVPFFKNFLLNIGVWFTPFIIFVIVGSSNAVNLTDGLDGLAIGPVIIAGLCFGLISYLVGNTVFAHYLQLHFIPGSGELAVLCGALVGAGLGFLWFNAPPALVFMGDAGSLALGGMLGTISIVTKHELVLAIMGGLFVMETVSVILQVGYFKLTKGKRIFLMAPLHHHFEKKGWAESTVVIRFWIISFILALIALCTLKLR